MTCRKPRGSATGRGLYSGVDPRGLESAGGTNAAAIGLTSARACAERQPCRSTCAGNSPASAGLATLATLVLLALTLRSLRRDELIRASEPRHDRRRRSARGRPDARAALALVGDALAATHNPRALVPVILDVVTEATGARGARIFRDGEELGWIGEPGGGRNELRLDLSAEDEATRTELVLYPPPEGFAAETRQLAEWLAAQAGIALENARLHDLVQRQAITDDLTGLVNRRRFLEVLDTEVERAAQFGSGLGIVLSTSTTSRASTTASATTREIACSRPSAVCCRSTSGTSTSRPGSVVRSSHCCCRRSNAGCRSGRRAVVSFAVGAPDRPGGGERAQLDSQLRRRPVPTGRLPVRTCCGSRTTPFIARRARARTGSAWPARDARPELPSPLVAILTLCR